MCLLAIPFASQAEVQPGDDFNANTAIAAAALQEWYNPKGLWDTTGWWNAANCVEAIENVIVAENGGPYLKILDQTFRENSRTNFLNEYYDDEGWWALAWIRAFDLTGEARYLNMSKTIFANMAGGWDSHCEGGIWWRKDKRYKNAIANELFLLTAIRLHQRTPGDEGANSYLDWAMRECEWFNKSGMINSQHLINDGLNRLCENNGRTTWTYNQGVILGGLTELYKTTGDTNYLAEATLIADAAIVTLNDGNGVLAEPCEPDRCGGGDVPQFKGIFIRYLAGLYDVTRLAAYHKFLVSNARSIWANDRDGSDRFGLRWDGPIDRLDAARHSSAMMPISALAEPVTTNLIFAKGSGSSAFSHEIGAPSSTLGWSCKPGTPRGLMQSGPYLESLPTGKHTVHFRLAVDATGRASESLVRLDVKEKRTGKLLAVRDIGWGEFGAANESQDFDNESGNQEAGDPLEFRVFWNAVSNAPVLTVTDVTVDGARNWTAANLTHEIGQLDGMNAWCADPLRNTVSGFLTKGANARDLQAGSHEAVFELKVDNFNWDDAKVATLSVVDADDERVIASKGVARNEFATTLYHGMVLKFNAVAGHRYDFRTLWHYSPTAPRLTQRSVIVR
jgi:predicted alpha-1,6-mannanase (GH76 family)